MDRLYIHEANDFLRNNKFNEALDLYKKASKYIDISMFSYNINLCLKNILKNNYPIFKEIYVSLNLILENIDIIFTFNNIINEYIQQSKKNKICIYTAIFGDYDKLEEPRYKEKNIDYFCFTDGNIKSNIFKIIKVNPLFKNNNTLSSRCLKALPHIFLKNYEISIWIDACTLIRGIHLENNIEKLLNGNLIAFHKHFQRSCVYKEIDECIKQRKDNEEKLINAKKFFQKENYPENNGLAETAQLIRKHCEKIIEFNELWWNFINFYTYRDQVSINYILYKLKISYSYLEGSQWNDPFFKRYLHNKSILIKYEPSIDIIILVHDGYEITKKCLTSIIQNTNYNNYKITIVDNNSNLETKTLLNSFRKNYTNIEIITNEKNLSFSKANNIAFKKSKSEYILFLNNDIEIIDRNWLIGLISEMENNKNIGAIGPLLLYPNYTIQSAGINIELINNTIKVPAQEYKLYRHRQKVNAITGACLLSRREILQKVNCFDEIYNYGQEDIDLCLKIQEFKYDIIFTPEYELIHHESYTRKFNNETLNNREKIKSKWKHRIHKLIQSNNIVAKDNKKNINYKTYNDLTLDILKNIHKISYHIDLVVGIPRSGMIPAYYISSIFNLPCISIDELYNNIIQTKGDRQIKTLNNDKISVLIVDDSFNLGNSLKRVINILPRTYNNKLITYHFLSVYSSENSNFNDFKESIFETLNTLLILKQPRIFQWNYRNHFIAKRACYDLDGVLCIDPTDIENDDGENYINFILNAKPLYVPHYEIYAIVTSRLEKYRDITEQWLIRNNIKYKNLFMLNLNSKEERIKMNCHASYKSEIYKNLDNTIIFFESNKNQSIEICKLSQKPVICLENDTMYYPQ